MSAINKNNIFEFALFKLKDSSIDKYLNNYPIFLSFINGFNGLKSIDTYQAINDKTIILDFAVWETIEDAIIADQKVNTDNDAKELMEPLEQVLHFDNTSFNRKFVNKNSNNNSFVELNVYELKEGRYLEAQLYRNEFYNRVINELPNLEKVLTFNSKMYDNIIIDLLFWNSENEANYSHEKLNNSNEFVKYMSTVKSLKHFIQMEKLNVEYHNQLIEETELVES